MDVFNKVTRGKPCPKEWKKLQNVRFTKTKKKVSLIIME